MALKETGGGFTRGMANETKTCAERIGELPRWEHPDGGTVISRVSAMLMANAHEVYGSPQPNLSAAVQRLEWALNYINATLERETVYVNLSPVKACIEEALAHLRQREGETK